MSTEQTVKSIQNQVDEFCSDVNKKISTVDSTSELVTKLNIKRPSSMQWKQTLKRILIIFKPIYWVYDTIFHFNLLRNQRQLLEKTQDIRNLLVPNGLSISHFVGWRIDERFYETQKMMDAFKNEILVEINRGKMNQTSTKIETRIINQDKIDKSVSLKLNVGSGRDIRPDYVNVDYRELAGVDVVADVKELPFKSGEVTEVLAAHLLEHFPEADGVEILSHWYSLLKKDGFLRIIVPNAEAMMRDYVNGTVPWETLRRIILGGQDYIGDFHYNTFSVETLERMLSKAAPGSRLEIVTTDRVNGGCKEIEIKAYKS